MAKRVAGICFVKADSAQLEVQGGVECPASETPDFPRKTLTESTDMTITAELANGTTYVLSGAYLVGEPAVNGDEGTIELEFNGMKGIWQ